MEYLIDPMEVKEEDGMELEIDPGLLLRKDHLSWLFHLINSIPMNPADYSANFCISCCRYVMPEELISTHRHLEQTSQVPRHLFPLIFVQWRDNGMLGGDYYVSVQALRELQVPIGDVMSHVLPHPHPRLVRTNVAGSNLARCLYVHPQQSREEMWQGAMISGKCAYRHCERIFNNRQSHLRLYGITPQYCSISCKIRTWLSCNS
ncbi:unnamed protein product [Calypogeia fissa]